ncbi:hypothetical protein JXQ70_17585 [bacterium]|nr:hypothetical protein [bacterium]
MPPASNDMNEQKIHAATGAFGYSGKYIVQRLLDQGKTVITMMITRDEIIGLMENRLFVQAPPAGTTKLTEWARQRATTLGRHYSWLAFGQIGDAQFFICWHFHLKSYTIDL